MAVITPVISDASGNCHVVSWSAIGDSDTCTPVGFAGARDKTVQINGTFGGATIVLEGSVDGTNYVTLTDPQGNSISKTSAALETVMENVQFIRPATSAGVGSSINVYLLMGGAR